MCASAVGRCGGGCNPRVFARTADRVRLLGLGRLHISAEDLCPASVRQVFVHKHLAFDSPPSDCVVAQVGLSGQVVGLFLRKPIWSFGILACLSEHQVLFARYLARLWCSQSLGTRRDCRGTSPKADARLSGSGARRLTLKAPPQCASWFLCSPSLLALCMPFLLSGPPPSMVFQLGRENRSRPNGVLECWGIRPQIHAKPTRIRTDSLGAVGPAMGASLWSNRGGPRTVPNSEKRGRGAAVFDATRFAQNRAP